MVGAWTWKKLIYINTFLYNAFESYFGRKLKSPREYGNFLVLLLAHELGHEIWYHYCSEEFKHEIAEKADMENFHTVYLDEYSRDDEKYRSEQFAEYVARRIRVTFELLLSRFK